RVVLGLVDLGERVGLDGQLRVELPDLDLAPGAAIGLHIAAQDVLVEADAERVLFEARFSRVADVGLGLPGPQRLDGLEEEVQGDEYVEDEADQDPGPDALGQVLDHVGAGTEQEDDGVDGGHDDEGEARLVVGQVDEVDRLVEHVREGPVALPRVEGAVRVLEQLLLLLGQLDGTPLFRLLLAVGRGDDRRRRGRRRVLGWRGRMPRRVVFVSSVGTGRFSDRHRTCSISAGRRYAPPGPTTPYQYTPRTLVAK